MIQGDLLIAPRRVVLPPALPARQWDDAAPSHVLRAVRGDRAFRLRTMELGVVTAGVFFTGVGVALSGR